MRFGAQIYESKRNIANPREWLRISQTRQSHIWSIPDEQRLDCPRPHTPPPHYRVKVRFLTYISMKYKSMKYKF